VKQVNPIIYLYGIQSKDLSSVMDYIYEGEVQLFQDDLDRFLNIAKRLKIEGMLGETFHEDGNSEGKVSTEGLFNMAQEVVDDFIEFKEKKQSQRKNMDNKSLSLIGQDSSRIEAFKAVDEIVTKKGDLWQCLTCGKTTKTSGQVRLHAEIHIDGLSFPCTLCNNTFRSRKHLARHKIVKHK